MLRFQTITLLVAVATLALTIFLFYQHPQGLLPDSGHRRDSGRLRSGADGFVRGDVAAASRQLAKVILKDPAVDSLESFIGIDGTNTTLNSGRILINLKPLEERKINASDVIRRLQPQLAEVAGITLFMQPVQDLTVEDRVSRTQFQYTLEDPNADELNTYAPHMLEKLQGIAGCCATWPATSRCRACAPMSIVDRDTASRLGITPSTIDQTLYDAYGQRASLHHVHAVEPVSRGAGTEAAASKGIRWICAICSSARAIGYGASGAAGLVSGGIVGLHQRAADLHQRRHQQRHGSHQHSASEHGVRRHAAPSSGGVCQWRPGAAQRLQSRRN